MEYVLTNVFFHSCKDNITSGNQKVVSMLTKKTDEATTSGFQKEAPQYGKDYQSIIIMYLG